MCGRWNIAVTELWDHLTLVQSSGSFEPILFSFMMWWVTDVDAAAFWPSAHFLSSAVGQWRPGKAGLLSCSVLRGSPGPGRAPGALGHFGLPWVTHLAHAGISPSRAILTTLKWIITENVIYKDSKSKMLCTKGLLTNVESQLWTIYSFHLISKNYSTKNPGGKRACMSESHQPLKHFNVSMSSANKFFRNADTKIKFLF